MKITISKTFQVKEYEPLEITVEEEAPVNSNEEYDNLKKKVSACVEDIAVEELAKWNKYNELINKNKTIS